MKNCLLSILLALFWLASKSQDLPPPPANTMNMVKGAYIIAADNSLQQNSASLFNIKTYGLVVHLLNNGIKVKWVINSAKVKDGNDFSVTADRQLPTVAVPSGIAKSFKGGPFVVFKADTLGVARLVLQYYSQQGLTGLDRPNVYISTANVSVDVRYNLVPPKGAVLVDGGNQDIHLRYMVAAGIPNINYTTSLGDDLTNCFSFASEPHNTATGVVVDTTIAHIRRYVVWGGNFLAQCAAVSNYENNALGRFQTTTGINVPNANIGATLAYPNPALSYSQYEGAYFSYDGASVVQNWRVNAATINNTHNHATGSGLNTSYIVASVAKLRLGNGGLVFYLNCHDFLAVAPQPLTINGLRMYMNAFITPAAFACPLPLDLVSFSGRLKNGKPNLTWIVGANETGDHFEVFKSFNGTSFTLSATIPVTDKEGLESYSYDEPNIINGKVYYRIKMVNRNGTYSNTRIIVLRDQDEANSSKLAILENPVGGELNFRFTASRAEEAVLTIYNINGVRVFNTRVKLTTGSNVMSLPIPGNLNAGTYVLELASNGERATAKMIKK